MPKVRTGGRRGGGGDSDRLNIYNTTDMMSARKKDDITRTAAEEAYAVARDIEKQYGFALPGTVLVSDIGRSNAMAYYDGDGNIGVNKNYFNAEKMNRAYDRCVEDGFHPPRGNKTGTEAVIAHEYGHALSEAAAAKMGAAGLRSASMRIVNEAQKAMGAVGKPFSANISGYAMKNPAETVAEAFADHYCNGNNAKAESKAIMDVLRKYL